MHKSYSLDKNFPVEEAANKSDYFSDVILRNHIRRTSRYLSAERKRLDVMKQTVEQQVAAYRQRKKKAQRNSTGSTSMTSLCNTNLSKNVSQSQPSLNKRTIDAHLTPIVEEDFDPLTTASTPPVRPIMLHCDSAPPFENNNIISVMNGISPILENGKDATEVFEEEDLVLDENGMVLGGSLRALIKRLIPRRDYCPDKQFMFAFLLNARIFVAPADLLHQILQHCMFEQNAASDNFKKEKRTRFFLNILRLCKEWTETFPYDFTPDLMLERLTELLSLCSVDNSSQQHSQLLLRNLSAKLTKLERYEKALTDIQKEVSHQVWPSENFCGITQISENPSDVAQQLTHIELERLSMIGPEEFVYALSKEYIEPDKGLSKSKPKTHNINHYIEWFNRLTFVVATEVTKHLKKRHRVKIIEFFIDVAKECFNIGNFNSLMAIVAGLNLNPVTRLKKTWCKVEKSKLQILQHQLDPSGNFTSYRATLKAAIWRSESGKNSSEKIVVPFFSLLLKDLLIMHHKCVRKLPNGHINFSMFNFFASQMQQFVRWKKVDCPFERNSLLLQYVLTSSAFSDKALQLASFECESPEQSSEKERHKRLKLELQWSR